MPTIILQVTDENGTIWDETEYNDNGCNTLEQLKADLAYIVNHPQDLAGPIVTLRFS